MLRLRMKLRDLKRNGLKILKNWWREILAISVLITLIGVSYVWLINVRWPDWTGFGEYIGPAIPQDQTFQRAKTLWDLMELLIIPAILVCGAYWLNESVRQREQAIANDNIHEAALQTYIDRMAELLIKDKLRKTRKESEIRDVARARTLTVLSRLDNERKGILLHFLYEAELIKNDYLFNWKWIERTTSNRGQNQQENKRLINFLKQNYNIGWVENGKIERIDNGNTIKVSTKEKYLLLSLNNEKVNLEFDDGTTDEFIAKVENDMLNIYQNKKVMDLSGADLSNVILIGANLRGASLSFANLSGADMRKANLSGANLMGAKLIKANLSEAYLMGTNLIGADLSGADLRDVNLKEARLTSAKLNRANLQRVIFTWAELNWNMNLQEADLSGADLEQLINFGGIDLKGALYNKDTKWPKDESGNNLFDPNNVGAIPKEQTFLGILSKLNQII